MAYKNSDVPAGEACVPCSLGISRRFVYSVVAALLFLVLFLKASPNSPYVDRSTAPNANLTVSSSNHTVLATPEVQKVDLNQNLHLLIPATHGDLNLCKTLLSAAMLEFPMPTLLAWEHDDEESNMLGGGSHTAKITATLKYINDLGPEHDDDLVLMVDAYDVWFQLPKTVLLSRYQMINTHADERIRKQIGQGAMTRENISQTVIFGAGKRCAPNQIHTIACYPIPPSPLPDDLYHGTTDTDIGITDYVSHRQRWLNSGLILGPVADMRRLFTYAKQVVEDRPDIDPEDNGSGTSQKTYRGSDQSVFTIARGEQEYQREVIRRRYQKEHGSAKTSWSSILSSKIFSTVSSEDNNTNTATISSTRKLAPRGRGNLDKLFPYDVLNPPFVHEHMDPMAGHPREFGIGVDHWSDLSHQTVNSEMDARWLIYNNSLISQIKPRTRFDCKMRLPEDPTYLPADILAPASTEVLKNVITGHGKIDGAYARWNDQNLYTHLCLGTIPIIVHHNGEKSAREKMWHEPWWQKYAKRAMDQNYRDESHKTRELEPLTWEQHLKKPIVGKGASWASAWTERGKKIVEFGGLCRKDYEKDLFR